MDAGELVSLFPSSWLAPRIPLPELAYARRRFGQAGWSRKYSFNTGDLKVCANVLQSYLDANKTVPWQDLRYIFGEIFYGGHVTDAWDRRTCNNYLQVSSSSHVCQSGQLASRISSPTLTRVLPRATSTRGSSVKRSWRRDSHRRRPRT